MRTGVPNIRRAVLVAALLMLQAGCSLVTIESPVTPLPERDLNARFLTRDFARHFAVSVAATADEIASASADPAIRIATLRWKINATAACREAATQLAPMTALVDTWAMTEQMNRFFNSGAGTAVFSPRQGLATRTSAELHTRMTEIVRAVTNDREFEQYREFIARYVDRHPIEDLSFRRESVLAMLIEESGEQPSLLRTVGSVPESMSDVADRLTIYGEQVPASIRWQVELALQQAGYEQGDIVQILSALDGHLERMATLAETGPDAMERSSHELRRALIETSARLDKSSKALMSAISAERAAISTSFGIERQAILSELGLQREALTREAKQIVAEWTAEAWQNLRSSLREFQLIFAATVLLILVLPFVAGYLTGRAMGKSASGSRS